MARTLAALRSGSRIADFISLGVIARWFPRRTVDRVLRESGKTSRRQRDLPAHVVVYYVIALALYRRLLEGWQWLGGPLLKVAGDSGISQARSRLGVEPLEKLHDELVRPLATAKTRGAFYRKWRLVSLDGSYRSAIYASETDQRKFHEAVNAELLDERVRSSRGMRRPRGVMRKMSGYKLRPRGALSRDRIDFASCVRVIK